MPPRREPIYGLDLIRFLAAAFVMLWHVGYRFLDAKATHIRVFVHGIPPGWHSWNDIARFGWIGVQIFFVISGLVIAYSAEGSRPRRFFAGRLERLWPAVVITVALVLAIDLALGMAARPLVRPAIRTLFFLPTGAKLVPQFWTLPVEIAFYGLVWLFIAARRADRLLWLAAMLLAASACYWIATLAGFGEHKSIARALLLQHGFYFSIGIALSTLGRGKRSFLATAILIAGLALAPVEIRSAMVKYGLRDVGPLTWIAPYSIWLAGVAAIALSLRYRSAVSRRVSPYAALARTSRLMGLMTYPLYLIHIHVSGIAATAATAVGLPVAAALLVGAVASVLVSAVIAVYCEPIVRQLLIERLRLERRDPSQRGPIAPAVDRASL